MPNASNSSENSVNDCYLSPKKALRRDCLRMSGVFS